MTIPSTPLFSPSAAPQRVREWISWSATTVEADLKRRLYTVEAATASPPPLAHVMEYAALAPGKRLRPAIAFAAAAEWGQAEQALPAASAIEMLHAYTLVHDDLPAMDDDDERRGRPTVHKAYTEAAAILAGDALVTEAFVTLADFGARTSDAIAVLGARAGFRELLAGQHLDVAAQHAQPPRVLTIEELEQMHRQKTGALFAAAAELGAIASSTTPNPTQRALAHDFGFAFGVVFQFADDLDDGEHSGLYIHFPARLEHYLQTLRTLRVSLDSSKPLHAFALWAESVGEQSLAFIAAR